MDIELHQDSTQTPVQNSNIEIDCNVLVNNTNNSDVSALKDENELASNQENNPSKEVESTEDKVLNTQQDKPSDEPLNNDDLTKKSDDKQKKKPKRISQTLIQEANIIQGDRLRTRNAPAPSGIPPPLNTSHSQSEQSNYQGTENKSNSKKNKQAGNANLFEVTDFNDSRKKNTNQRIDPVSGLMTLREPYVSKTPDFIISIVDDVMRSDKIDCLRRQFLGVKIDDIPNLSKYSERKKDEDFQLKLFGDSITVFKEDQNKLKRELILKEQQKREAQLLEEQKLKDEEEAKRKQKEEENEKRKVEINQDQFNNNNNNVIPKSSYSHFDGDQATPHKLLSEDILLDEQGMIAHQQLQCSPNGYSMVEDCNPNGFSMGEDSNPHHDLHNIINDVLLNQLDDQSHHQGKDMAMQEELDNIGQFGSRNIMNQHEQIVIPEFKQPDQVLSTSLGQNLHIEGNILNDLNHNNNLLAQQPLIDRVQLDQQTSGEYQTKQLNVLPQEEEEKEQYLSEISNELRQKLDSTNVNCIEAIRERAIDNVYFSFDDFDKDFKKLFGWILLQRCTSLQSFNYMCNVMESYINITQRRAAKTKTIQAKQQDLLRLFKLDIEKKIQVKNWPFIPQSHRTYERITQYSPEPPSNKKYIFETLRSEKKPQQCPDSCCCMSLQTLGTFSLEHGTWNSECPNRKERIECDHHDCQNSQSKHKRQKQLEVDVKETLCWGIDQYTKKNIFHILPENENDEDKYQFIKTSLLKSANLLENEGWEMAKVCNFIIRNSESKKSRLNRDSSKLKIGYIFSAKDRKFAKLLLKAVDLQIDAEAFRIHPKGMGVICLNRNGITHNDLIVEYIGEIYRPYRWFERQDFVKKYMKDNNQKDVLPDFYNIMLELHKNEGKGIDILYVDPMQKGNYSSRLSHSCDPNCGTVVTISNSSYNISMFAMKNIEYGEELAFDYSAVTESKNEHRQSTCLCGTHKCRGRYIELSNNNQKEYNYILDKMHCFLKRNSDLVRSGSEQLTQDDLDLLNKFNLRKNVQSNCENWLLKWAAITLRTVQEEQELFLSDQLVQNRFIQQNDKDIAFVKRAISIKQDREKEQVEKIEMIDENGQREEVEEEVKLEKQQEEQSNIKNEDEILKEEQQEKIEEINNEENQETKQEEEEELNKEEKQQELEGEEKVDNNQEGEMKVEDNKQVEGVQEEKEVTAAVVEGDKEEKIEVECQKVETPEEDNKTKRKLRNPKPLKPAKLSAAESIRLAEEERVNQLAGKDHSELLELLSSKETERQRNVDYLVYMSKAHEENRLQNIIITLDKVKFYLNSLGDKNPPLRYLTQTEIVSNLWGNSFLKFSTNQSRKSSKQNRLESAPLSIIEELLDLIKSYYHYAQCKYAEKYFRLIHPFVLKYYKESPEKALLAFRLACLNIHEIFTKIETPLFHAGALNLILYFYAFTHTYFTPHEFAQFNSEKMTITDTEMFNLELLDEEKRTQKKQQKKKNYEEQRSYSSQFVWGQLTVWFKQTVASPQATLSQDRRGTLSYPQLNQSFKTTVLSYPFQEKNDTFLNHLKEKPKDMWPPEQAKWSFKNSLKNYGTLLFEGIHSQDKIPNLIEKVIALTDESFEEKLKLFIEVEGKLSSFVMDDINEMQQECFDAVKKQLSECEFITTEKSLKEIEQEQARALESQTSIRQVRKSKKADDYEDDDLFGDVITKKQKRKVINKRKNESESDDEEEEESQEFDEDDDDDEDIVAADDDNDNDEGLDDVDEIESNKSQIYEGDEEQNSPTQHNNSQIVSKNRQFNQYILNKEEDCLLNDDTNLQIIASNPSLLKKHLVIDINKELVNSILPKIKPLFAKKYASMFSKKESQNDKKSLKSQEKNKKKSKKIIQSTEEEDGRCRIKNQPSQEETEDKYNNLSMYRNTNEDSRKSTNSQVSQNSQDSSQRRSSRPTTKFDYDKLLSKKTNKNIE